MCGIAGLIKFKETVSSDDSKLLFKGIQHRGPDGKGCWFSEDRKTALVHARLSIIDLTNHSNQPMTSPSGRFVIVYNGEIYNYLEIKKALKQLGCQFSSTGDTEILLLAIEYWGLEHALEKLNGMFAFCLYDLKLNKLYLVRDRIGIKPLYYYIDSDKAVFSSDLASIMYVNSSNNSISSLGLTKYLFSGYIAREETILNGAKKLLPGTILEVNFDGSVNQKTYYNLRKKFDNPISQISSNEIEERLDFLINQAVCFRTRADVPVGLFLSGGVDSSYLASVLSANQFNIESFSIGFLNDEFNELDDARMTAAHLGLKHNEHIFTESDLISLFEIMPSVYSEPFSDISQFPTYFVSRFAKQKVKVALCGDGGDELFAGYTRYFFVNQFWSKLSYLPLRLRLLVARILLNYPKPIAYILNRIKCCLLNSTPIPLLEQKLVKASKMLGINSISKAHFALSSQWLDPSLILQPDWINDNDGLCLESDMPDKNITTQQQYLDMKTYLAEDILTKTDRASMSVGLEARVPFLDHNIVAYAASIPHEYMINQGKTKWILKKCLEKYLPTPYVHRQKRGFGIPIDAWLRGPLKDLVGAYLNESLLKDEGIFDYKQVSQIWNAHLSGDVNKGGALWTIAAFQMWKKRYLE